MTALTLTFQPVTTQNLHQVQELAAALWPDAFADLLSPEQITFMMDMMYSDDVLRAELKGGVIYELLVSEDGAIGYGSYGPVREAICPLHKLYVLQACRGQGAGRRMFERIATYACTQGARTLRLRVNRGNAGAVRAYQSWGFTIAGEDVKDIGHGFVMDDYIMDFPLPSPTASGRGEAQQRGVHT